VSYYFFIFRTYHVELPNGLPIESHQTDQHTSGTSYCKKKPNLSPIKATRNSSLIFKIFFERFIQNGRLQVFNENVYEVTLGRDYRIDFRSGDLNLALHIRLGKSFPSERPEVHVEPPVLHPWVDPLGKVDSPGLREEGI
jgi:hypothetical protein